MQLRRFWNLPIRTLTTIQKRSAEYGSSLRGKLHDFAAPTSAAPRVDSTRNSWEELFIFLQRSAFREMSPDRAYLHVNHHVKSDNGKQSDGLEGFARTFLGLSFFMAGGPNRVCPEAEFWQEAYLEGLCNGTDPSHSGFWGAIQSPQLLVESASIALGLMISGPIFWSRLSPKHQNNLLNQFRANIHRQFWENNWLWFRIIHLLALENLGGEDHRDAIMKDIDHLTLMYRGDGWYHDGMPRDGYRHLDYYNAYAMHFYGLLFSRLQGGRHEAVADELRRRARIFFTDYQHLFAPGGHPPVFGRSMIYRFAAIAPWGLGLLTSSCDVPVQTVKMMCVDTVNAYLDNGCIERSGRLGSGVYGEQLFIRESYSGGGSPYWAYKAFSLLLLPHDHDFWSSSVGKKNEDTDGVFTLAGGDLLTVKQGSHVLAVNPALTHPWYGLKYNRFAYSNRYLTTLDDSFPVDNMLLVRRKGMKHWGYRSGVINKQKRALLTSIHWQVNNDESIIVQSTLMPLVNGYIVWHVLLEGNALEFATGGFAVPSKNILQTVSHGSELTIREKDKWTAMVLLAGSETKAYFLRSKMGIGTRLVTIPCFSGNFAGAELGVAILSGANTECLETLIQGAHDSWNRLLALDSNLINEQRAAQ